MLRAAPLQIMSIIQQSCADAAGWSSSRIVAFGIGVAAFAASVSSLAMRLGHQRIRLAFKAAVCPLSLPSSVTRAVARLLSSRGQFSLQFTVLLGQTVQRRRTLLLHRSDGFFPTTVVQRCRERGAFQTIQLVQFADRVCSATMINESLR